MSADGKGAQASVTDAPRKTGVFSAITDLASARRAAKEGAVGGFVFAGMYVLGAYLQYGSAPHAQEEAIILFAVYGALTALILFLTWRVRGGRGVISAGILLLWFVGESVLKVLGGTVHLGWVFFYLIVAVALLQGLRGCWNVRRYRHADVADTFT